MDLGSRKGLADQGILRLAGFAFKAVAAVGPGELADREPETIHDGQMRTMGHLREQVLPEPLLDRRHLGRTGSVLLPNCSSSLGHRNLKTTQIHVNKRPLEPEQPSL